MCRGSCALEGTSADPSAHISHACGGGRHVQCSHARSPFCVRIFAPRRISFDGLRSRGRGPLGSSLRARLECALYLGVARPGRSWGASRASCSATPCSLGWGRAGCAQSTGWEGGFGGMFHACAAAYTHVVMLLLGNRACALCEMSGFAEPVNRLSSLFVIVLWVMWPD